MWRVWACITMWYVSGTHKRVTYSLDLVYELDSKIKMEPFDSLNLNMFTPYFTSCTLSFFSLQNQHINLHVLASSWSCSNAGITESDVIVCLWKNIYLRIIVCVWLSFLCTRIDVFLSYYNPNVDLYTFQSCSKSFSSLFSLKKLKKQFWV